MKERNTNAILEQGMSGGSCTCGELRKAARVITLLYDNTFKSSGLLSTQLFVLDFICNNDSIRISDLAKKLGLDRTTHPKSICIRETGFYQDLIGKRPPNENCDCYSKRT
jgi:hypothetical protein